jgi:hypothetical protein
MDQSLSADSIISNEHSIFKKYPEFKISIMDALKESSNWKRLGKSAGQDFNEKDFQIVPMLSPNMPKFLNYLEKKNINFRRLILAFEQYDQHEIVSQITALMTEESIAINPNISSSENSIMKTGMSLQYVSDRQRKDPNKIYIDCLGPAYDKKPIFDERTKGRLLGVLTKMLSIYNVPVWYKIASGWLKSEFYEEQFKEYGVFKPLTFIKILSDNCYLLSQLKTDFYEVALDDQARLIPDV